MILITRLRNFPGDDPFQKPVLTLGSFDGIHLGHQCILKRVRVWARKIRGTSCVLTFQELPQRVLRPQEKTGILTSFWHKMSLIRKANIDVSIALHFNRTFSNLSPEDFVKRILVDKLRVHQVILGHDSRFGHNREGDAEAMAFLAKKYGFGFERILPVKKSDFTVSSTLIRRLISEGHLDTAGKLLGRTYSVMASVVRGTGRGKTLGFPTANLDPHSEVLPPGGVYLAHVRVVRMTKKLRKNGFYLFEEGPRPPFLPAVLNLGTRPTFRLKSAKILAEAHLLHFRGNLYGKTLEVEFLERLRDEIKFETVRDLQDRIRQDVKSAERFFSKNFTRLQSCHIL